MVGRGGEHLVVDVEDSRDFGLGRIVDHGPGERPSFSGRVASTAAAVARGAYGLGLIDAPNSRVPHHAEHPDQPAPGDGPVNMASQMGTLTDGATYTARTELMLPSSNLGVDIVNTGYRKLM